MAELSPILAELERLRDVLVREYPVLVAWNSNEAPPVVAIASKGRKKNVTGWYNPAVWVDQQDTLLDSLSRMLDDSSVSTQEAPKLLKRAELVIASELLNNPLRAVSELARQLMVHTGQAKVGKNLYYPAEWFVHANAVDHRASVLPDQPTKGWAKWDYKPAFQAKMDPHINYALWDVARDSDAERPKVGSRMHVWQCPACGRRVRAAGVLYAVCVAHKAQAEFQWAEDPAVLHGMVGETLYNALYAAGRVKVQ